METTLTYETAFKELEEIVNNIQNETVSVDILAQKVARANELLKFCREKLRSTEVEVNKVIGQMEDNK